MWLEASASSREQLDNPCARGFRPRRRDPHIDRRERAEPREQRAQRRRRQMARDLGRREVMLDEVGVLHLLQAPHAARGVSARRPAHIGADVEHSAATTSARPAGLREPVRRGRGKLDRRPSRARAARSTVSAVARSRASRAPAAAATRAPRDRSRTRAGRANAIRPQHGAERGDDRASTSGARAAQTAGQVVDRSAASDVARAAARAARARARRARPHPTARPGSSPTTAPRIAASRALPIRQRSIDAHDASAIMRRASPASSATLAPTTELRRELQ